MKRLMGLKMYQVLSHFVFGWGGGVKKSKLLGRAQNTLLFWTFCNLMKFLKLEKNL